MPKRREASCCKVEVVKGGAGRLVRLVFLTPVTVNGAFLQAAMTLSADSLSESFSSPF